MEFFLRQWFGEVSALYRRAIVTQPSLKESYHNLAALLLNRHAEVTPGEGARMLSEAKQLLNFALRQFPNYDRIKFLIPAVDEAWRNLQSELRLNPLA